MPVSIASGSSLKESLRIMRKEKVSHLIVRSTDNKLLGVISKQDVMDSLFSLISRTTGKTYTALELEALTAYDIMISNPYSLTEDSSAKEAAQLLVEHKINCIPVVDKTNTIVGVITSYDILKDSI